MNLDHALVVELVNAVTDQLHYLDAPDQGKFDSGPTMLQRADARVRAAHRAIVCPEHDGKCPEVGAKCPEVGAKCPELTSEHLHVNSEHSASSSEHCDQDGLFGRKP